MTLAVPRIKSLLTPFPASTLKALKFGVKAPALPFRLDVHVLLWKSGQRVAHEYLLGVSPQLQSAQLHWEDLPQEDCQLWVA